jgi:hypothetical protein
MFFYLTIQQRPGGAEAGRPAFCFCLTAREETANNTHCPAEQKNAGSQKQERLCDNSRTNISNDRKNLSSNGAELSQQCFHSSSNLTFHKKILLKNIFQKPLARQLMNNVLEKIDNETKDKQTKSRHKKRECNVQITYLIK